MRNVSNHPFLSRTLKGRIGKGANERMSTRNGSCTRSTLRTEILQDFEALSSKPKFQRIEIQIPIPFPLFFPNHNLPTTSPPLHTGYHTMHLTTLTLALVLSTATTIYSLPVPVPDPATLAVISEGAMKRGIEYFELSPSG
ncbi:uncharacterized protein MYCFIDRAFT_175003 [Pseudocercospora fijiensis CIRAD86]|uniref:Uncharacterized protein n=1 Tax=Pseudocercospora fijiensis (strain CIRAD86) TaxID=383855 RepID=M2ZX57_PSEFD|nr:uncharacterized protein MYCFIDRAFT_175003 [Pseudocercospora fijiensis CIRAD86]EME83574.1 hypothetical protein MYCFIDRAFT_175003 [Pseudocercospora fijiensis CIRAD86]